MQEIPLEKVDACILCGSREVAVLDQGLSLCRCGSCGLVFDNPRPTAGALQAYYSQPGKYSGWLEHERERERLWLRRLAKIRKRRRSGSLLDIGAGTGQFPFIARAFFSPVSGTEVSSSARTIARDRYGIELLEGTVDSIDFRDRTFDVITVFHVLEHVPYPGRFLEKCRSLLSPGGMLFIAVPNELRSLRHRAKGLLKILLKHARVPRFRKYGRYGFSKIEFSAHHEEIHLSHFTAANLEQALRASGFTPIESSLDPFFAVPFPRLWLENAYCAACALLARITGINVYDTIWVAAEKKTG